MHIFWIFLLTAVSLFGARTADASILGMEIDYVYDYRTVTTGRDAPSQSDSRVASTIKISKSGDVFYFQETGSQASGEIFQLGKTVDFLVDRKRADPRRSEALNLSYYKGNADFKDSTLTLSLAFGGRSKAVFGGGVDAAIRLEVAISADRRSCSVRQSHLRMTGTSGNVTEGEIAGQTRCIVNTAGSPASASVARPQSRPSITSIIGRTIDFRLVLVQNTQVTSGLFVRTTEQKSSTERYVGRIRVTKDRDVFFFTLDETGSVDDKGHIYKLDREIDFARNSDRAHPNAVKLSIINHWKGTAAFRNGVMSIVSDADTTLRATNQRRVAREEWRIVFPPDFSSCKVEFNLTMKIRAVDMSEAVLQSRTGEQLACSVQ